MKTSALAGSLFLFLGATALAQNAAPTYQYKLFQFANVTMERDISQFATSNPGWEIIAFSPAASKSLGSGISIPTEIMVLARMPVTPPAPIQSAGVPVAAPHIGLSRVSVVASPAWDTNQQYATSAAFAINAKLAPYAPAVGGQVSLDQDALVDVVVTPEGAVQLASPRSNHRTPADLVTAAVAAIQAASPFKPFPSGIMTNGIPSETFTFSIAP